MTNLQDSLRSAVYRSLTKPLADGCQNENQTVTVACTTHALSKISSFNSNPVQRKGHRELEEKAMEHRYKGERAGSVDFLSRHSAEDLEESIAMLSKLQEASKRMSHSKPWKKREGILLEEDRNDDIMSSRRFSVQEPRFSVDGSSKIYNEAQLRRWRMSPSKYRQRSEFLNEEFDVSERMSSTRFGFQEQRHSVDGSAEEMHRMSQLFQLKQWSELQEDDIGVEGRLNPRFSFDGSSRAQIFKLQEPRFSDSIEELRRVIKNSLCQQSLLSRSPEDDRTCTGQYLSPERGSRFQRFKGTVSNDDDAEGRLSPPHFVSATPQAKTPKGPNLIAKLMGLEEVSLQQTVEPIKKEEMKRSLGVPIPTSDIERPTARKLQLVEKKKKKASPNQKSLMEIIEAMQSKGLLKSGQVDVPRIKAQRFNGGRNFRMDDESPPIVIMKPLYLPQWERGKVQKYILRDKSFADDKILNADLIQEKRVSDHGPMLLKPLLDRKEVERIEKSKVDFSSASSKKKREVAFKTREKANEKQKPQLEEKKRPVKAERTPISQSTAAKSDKRLSTAKNKVSPVKPESTKKYSANPLKERKILRRKSDRKSTDIQMDDESCKNDKEANPVHKMDTVSDTATLLADTILQQPKKETKTYEKDAARADQEPFCEVMPKTSQAKKIPEVVSKEVIHFSDTKPAARKEASVEDDLTRLLLSSKSFVTRAQELHGIDAPQPIHHQTKGIEDDVMRNAKFYLDCGNELMARKSHKHELMMYPISQTQMCGPRASSTLYQLAEEISSRISTLTSYTKADRNMNSDDVLYLRLGRDLTCNDVSANSMWDIGWLNWGYPEEAVQLVCEVEESILSLLVAEVATELVY